MEIAITITGATPAQLAAILCIHAGTVTAQQPETFPEAVQQAIDASVTEGFPDVPDVANGTVKKPRKGRATEKKFIDPGDQEPGKQTADPFTTNGVDPGTANIPDTGVELDDFGDPIKPVAPAPVQAPAGIKITIDLLRTAMQAKSTASPENKAKCQALVASYNVQTMSMVQESLWPELYAKIQAI